MSPALAAGYEVYRAEAAIAAGDGTTAQQAWHDAIAQRPDSYGLRALHAEMQDLPAEVPMDQRLVIIHRIRATMESHPVVRSPLPGQSHPRIDQLD